MRRHTPHRKTVEATRGRHSLCVIVAIVIASIAASTMNVATARAESKSATQPAKPATAEAAKKTADALKDDGNRAQKTTANSNALNGVFGPGIAAAQERTVRIYGAGIGREKGYASGIIVSEEGHILTASGIYLAGSFVRVAMRDGRLYNASIVRRSEGLQAALLKIDAKTPKHFTLKEKVPAGKGDWIMSVSNAFKVADRDEDLSVNLGVITMRSQLDARHRTQDVDYEGDVLLFDAITSNPGAGGGAVVNINGELVGMIGKLIASKSTNTRLNYAVPVDQLKAFVDGKTTAPKVVAKPAGKPYLGVRLFTLSGKRAPAYIDRIVPGSPAKTAGLRKDDLVLVLNDEIVRSIRDYEKVFAELAPGTEVSIVVKRKNQVLTTTMKVGEKK